MIIPLTIIPLTLPSFSLSCSWQLTRHDSNPALTRLHPQSQTWAKLRFDPIDDPQTGQPFDLLACLRLSPILDLPLLLGPERVPVRLVAFGNMYLWNRLKRCPFCNERIQAAASVVSL